MTHPIIRKMLSDIIKELDYDIWKDTYPTGRDRLIDFNNRTVRSMECIATEAIRELTDMDFDNE